jgi:hypothetical protein
MLKRPQSLCPQPHGSPQSARSPGSGSNPRSAGNSSRKATTGDSTRQEPQINAPATEGEDTCRRKNAEPSPSATALP